MAGLRVSVTVSDERLDRFAQVVAALQAAGLRLEAALEGIGGGTGGGGGAGAVERLRPRWGASAASPASRRWRSSARWGSGAEARPSALRQAQGRAGALRQAQGRAG